MEELIVEKGTMIGFSANKTEEQAQADTSSNRMTICKEKVLYMNGQRLGLTDNEADYIGRKVQEEYNAKAALQVSVSKGTQDAAAPVDVTVTVKTLFSGSLVDADTIPTIEASGFSGKTLTKTETGTYTCVLEGKSTAVSVNVAATIKGVKKSGSAYISAYHKIHYGVSALDALSGSIPSDFKTRGPQSSAAGTYDFVFAPNTYGFILVPKDVSLPNSMQGSNPSGVEGPLPVPFVKLADLVVGGVTYTQLRIASKQAASTHNVKFA